MLRWEGSEAQEVVAVLEGLNSLRIASAHSLERDLESPFKSLGFSAVPSTPRDAWDSIVDAVVMSLHRVAAGVY